MSGLSRAEQCPAISPASGRHCGLLLGHESREKSGQHWAERREGDGPESWAATEFDPVERPVGYNSHPSGVEAITICEHYGFCIENAMKYLWRAGLKPGADALEDLRKAAWYLKREIERREGETL